MIDFIGDDGVFGEKRADRLAERLGCDRAGGGFPGRIGDARRRLLARAELVRQPFERLRYVLLAPRQHMGLAILGREQARLVRIGEEGDRRARADENEMLHAFEHVECLIDRIGKAADGDAPGAALGAG